MNKGAHYSIKLTGSVLQKFLKRANLIESVEIVSCDFTNDVSAGEALDAELGRLHAFVGGSFKEEHTANPLFVPGEGEIEDHFDFGDDNNENEVTIIPFDKESPLVLSKKQLVNARSCIEGKIVLHGSFPSLEQLREYKESIKYHN